MSSGESTSISRGSFYLWKDSRSFESEKNEFKLGDVLFWVFQNAPRNQDSLRESLSRAREQEEEGQGHSGRLRGDSYRATHQQTSC